MAAWNGLRATFARAHDRVIAALMLVAALAVLRAILVDRPGSVAVWAAIGAGALGGLGAGRLVRVRLAHHAFDGLLAADALDRSARRRYSLAWHGVGLALLAAVTLIVHPSLLIVAVTAYLAGALIAAAAPDLAMPRAIAGTTRPGWVVRSWRHRPVVGIVAATLLLLSLLPARSGGMDTMVAILGSEAVLLALALTGVDDAIVRFMTIAGYGTARIVGHHARGLGAFLVVAVPGCWLMADRDAGSLLAAIVAAAAAATLMLLGLRILAYRLHTRRFADILVSGLVGVLLLVAYALPVALPVVVTALLWSFARRGRAKAWLLA